MSGVSGVSGVVEVGIRYSLEGGQALASGADGRSGEGIPNAGGRVRKL